MPSFKIYELATGRTVIVRDFPSEAEAGEKRRRLAEKLGRDLGLLRELNPDADNTHIIKMVNRYLQEVSQ